MRKEIKTEHGASIDTAFRAIRDMIVQGNLAPGSWIVEDDLSKKLEMSRTPVRSALQWLLHEGYLVAQETGSKSKMMVAPLTASDARELYAIVGRIEGIAGRMTVELPEQTRLSLAKTLRRLNVQLEKLTKADARGPDKFVDIDTAFHDKIVESSAGPRLLGIYNAIKPQTERYWRFYSNTANGELAASCEEHEQVVKALTRGDGKAVERALHLNWQNGAERLIRSITAVGERGAWR